MESKITSLSADEAEAILRHRLARGVQDFCIVFGDGGIVLRGWARSYYDKQLAQHLAMRHIAAPIRANEIEVRRYSARGTVDHGSSEETNSTASSP